MYPDYNFTFLLVLYLFLHMVPAFTFDSVEEPGPVSTFLSKAFHTLAHCLFWVIVVLALDLLWIYLEQL